MVSIDPTYSSKGLIASEDHCEGGLMAKKWDGSKVIKEIDEALDRAQAEFLTNTQQAECSVPGEDGPSGIQLEHRSERA